MKRKLNLRKIITFGIYTLFIFLIIGCLIKIIFFNKKTVDVKRVVNVAANNQSVSEILDRAFEGTGIHYVMEGNILCIPYPVLLRAGGILNSLLDVY